MFCVSNDDLRDLLWEPPRTSLRYPLGASLGVSLWESLSVSLQSVYKGVEYVLCV